MMTSESVQSDVTSLLDRLRSPTPSILACKRQFKQNPPPQGVKRGNAKESGDPKNISASDHVKAYPDEQLTVSNRKLFCRACREELSTKKSSIESYLKSQKHIKGKKKLELKNKEEYHQYGRYWYIAMACVPYIRNTNMHVKISAKTKRLVVRLLLLLFGHFCF